MKLIIIIILFLFIIYFLIYRKNKLKIIFDDYMKYINKNEYSYRYKNLNIKNVYLNNIKDLTKNDKNIINNKIKKLNIILKNYKLRNNCHWNFKLLNPEIDFGFPFTLDNYIFIQHSNIDIGTLLHEQIHIHQRNNKNLYKQLYNKLGFNILQNKKLLYEFIKKNNIIILTNPDGLDIYIYNNRYIPLLIIYDSYPKEILIDTYKITNINKWDIKDIFYKSSFNIEHSLYHPNEITAESISQYIINNKKINNIIIEFINNFI